MLPRAKASRSETGQRDATPYDVFGPYRLMRNEDQQAFAALQLEVEKKLQPQAFFDFLSARELTIKIWEIERLRRASGGVADNPAHLAALIRGVLDYDELKSMNIAMNYYSRDHGKRQHAESLLEKDGITPDIIDGYITNQSIGVQKLLLDLLHRHEASRDRMIKKALKETRKMTANDMNRRSRAGEDSEKGAESTGHRSELYGSRVKAVRS
jgi:hypothetical protein